MPVSNVTQIWFPVYFCGSDALTTCVVHLIQQTTFANVELCFRLRHHAAQHRHQHASIPSARILTESTVGRREIPWLSGVDRTTGAWSTNCRGRLGLSKRTSRFSGVRGKRSQCSLCNRITTTPLVFRDHRKIDKMFDGNVSRWIVSTLHFRGKSREIDNPPRWVY